MFLKKKSNTFTTISPNDAMELIKSNQNNSEFVILDVRTVPEFEESHLSLSINLDFFSENFKDELAKKDKNRIYLVYCKSGRRSLNSAKIMEEMGFKEVYNLEGGIMKWQRNQLPLNG